MKDYIGFVYIWINKVNGKKYLGSHLGTVDDGYIGSGLAFNRAIKKYGISNFERIIVEYVNTNLKELRECEQYYLNLYEAAKSDEFYNISPNASLGWAQLKGRPKPDKFKEMVSKRHKNKIVSEETKELIRQAAYKRPKDSVETRKKKGDWFRNKKYFTNGSEEIRCFPGEEPEGWIQGRRDEEKEKLRNKTKGMVLCNNGIEQKLFQKDSIPDGWIQGMLESEREKIKGENNNFFNKKHKEESKKKMSEKKKGKYCGASNPAAKAVLINNIIYETKKDAMKVLNITYSKLQEILKQEGNYEINKKDCNKTR